MVNQNMGQTILSVQNPNQVVSARSLDVLLGDPPRRMMIFTGIAAPHLVDREDDLVRETVIVRLGQTVAQAPKEGEWTAAVGLAHVDNSESDLLYALDRVADLRVE